MRTYGPLLPKSDGDVVRAVIDHNVWVSGLISQRGASYQIFEAFAQGRFQFVTCLELLDELAEVLCSPRLAKYGITLADAREFRALLLDGAALVSVSRPSRVCRDPDDDLLIETALIGRASVIVTGDSDLIDDPAVSKFLGDAGIRVLEPFEFIGVLPA